MKILWPFRKLVAPVESTVRKREKVLAETRAYILPGDKHPWFLAKGSTQELGTIGEINVEPKSA